jgi:uncharacterized LabA/DUF88 family protein
MATPNDTTGPRTHALSSDPRDGRKMRTIVYVDGFNLYYSALKGTRFKWLNLKALFTSVLQPHNQLVAIKYFTARISSTPSDPLKADHQDAYIRALQTTTPELKVYLGLFATHQRRAKLVTPMAGQRYVDIYRTDEKGSDVNLAVHLVNDAWLDVYDCGVVVSGDSDLAEAMTLVKTFHARKKLGLLTCKKGTSKELVQKADFVKAIPSAALGSCQFQDHIPGTNIRKPPDW